MKGIALVRVSTDSQDLKQQTEEVVKQMISDGYKVEDIITIEDKESGVRLSEEERQGLNKLKYHIQKKKYSSSLFYSFKNLFIAVCTILQRAIYTADCSG
jgi:DNA invertase Pin-like site-specific DNA recombinase